MLDDLKVLSIRQCVPTQKGRTLMVSMIKHVVLACCLVLVLSWAIQAGAVEDFQTNMQQGQSCLMKVKLKRVFLIL